MACCFSSQSPSGGGHTESNRPVSGKATHRSSSKGKASIPAHRGTRTAGHAKANSRINNNNADDLQDVQARLYWKARALQVNQDPDQDGDLLDAWMAEIMGHFHSHLSGVRREWEAVVDYERSRADEFYRLSEERRSQLIWQDQQIKHKDAQLQLLSKKATEERESLERRHRLEKDQLERLHENNAIAIQQAWGEDNQKFKHQLEVQVQEHNYAITSLQNKHASAIIAAENEMDAMRAASADREREYHAEIEKQQERARAEQESLTISHKHAITRIQKETQQFQDVLLTQDQDIFLPSLFRTTTLPEDLDKGMKSKFMDIYRLVEEISRSVWKEHADIWTAHELQKACIRQTDRAVKQALLQDMIWSVLFVHIFCSPFRMFGGIGRQLESEWSQAYGTIQDSHSRTQQEIPSESAYHAPSPSVQAERWRYMTLMGCREALETPLSSQDPRAAIKLGWSKAQSDMNREMKAELLKVVDAPDIKSGQIKRICETAARVWLDLVMHRCRVEISLMGPDCSAAEKLRRFKDLGSLTLTRSPSIGRHGNSKGGELGKFTILADCAGDAVAIP